MNRSPSLLYRWSSKYRWSERAWQRDQAYGREQEAALRDERQEMARRQLRDSDRLQRLSMAKLTSLVRRDPDTGELQLDPSVKPRDAVAIYRLALEIQEAAAAAAAPEKEATESSDDQLGRLSDSELQQIIQLAKERASDDESTKED